MKTFAFLVRSVLTIVFLWAAIVKIADPRAFLDAILSYGFVPAPAAAAIAVWLPWIELTVALGLWVKQMASAASGMLALLALTFTAALTQAWIRGIDITCGCFGAPSTVHGADYLPFLVRDLFLVAAAVMLWRFENRTAPVRTDAVSPD